MSAERSDLFPAKEAEFDDENDGGDIVVAGNEKGVKGLRLN